MIGKTIDGYEITEEIGRGSAATVYVARQQPVGRYVALKVFDHLTADSTARLQRLYDQVELFDHVNILPIYDRGQAGERSYWVMRYMPAGTLKSRLRGSNLEPAEVDQLVSQIAAALDYAHQHELIHGDLKPSNVLLDHAGNAFVVDFGLYEIVGQTLSAYQPPEQRRDSKPTVQADVYALGAMLYELLTGKPPIDQHTHDDARTNRRLVAPAPPSTLSSKLNAAVDQVVLKALAIDPAQRYQTPTELAAAFSEATKSPAPSTVSIETPSAPGLAPTPVEAAIGDRVEDQSGAALPPIRRVSARRSNFDWRWLVSGLVGLIVILAIVSRFSSSSIPAAPQPTSTAAPTASAAAPAVIQPTATASATASPLPTSTASPILASTSTPTITPTQAVILRPFFTPTLSVEPLELMFPRRENGSSLTLTFRTHVRPDGLLPIGTLSMSVPPIEPLVVDKGLARVSSGEQVLQVSIQINCAAVSVPITTHAITLTIQSDQAQPIFGQVLDYTKTWCP
jgi:serine/threonine protein kinase